MWSNKRAFFFTFDLFICDKNPFPFSITIDYTHTNVSTIFFLLLTSMETETEQRKQMHASDTPWNQNNNADEEREEESNKKNRLKINERDPWHEQEFASVVHHFLPIKIRYVIHIVMRALCALYSKHCAEF